MYGCANAVLVYGFNMGDQEYIIYYDYLKDKFPGIYEYASVVIRNCLCEAVYGISCGLDNKTGQAIISDEEKDKVKKLYNKYVEYMKKQLSRNKFEEKIKDIKLGFHLAISGDYETCHDTIILDTNWDQEEDEEQFIGLNGEQPESDDV